MVNLLRTGWYVAVPSGTETYHRWKMAKRPEDRARPARRSKQGAGQDRLDRRARGALELVQVPLALEVDHRQLAQAADDHDCGVERERAGDLRLLAAGGVHERHEQAGEALGDARHPVRTGLAERRE